MQYVARLGTIEVRPSEKLSYIDIPAAKEAAR